MVYSSVAGAERRSGVPHFESKRRIEEHLIASGLSVAFVRPARYEGLPVEVVGDDDQEAMFTWIAGPAGFDADVAATRALDPDLRTFGAWLSESGPELDPADAHT